MLIFNDISIGCRIPRYWYSLTQTSWLSLKGNKMMDKSMIFSDYVWFMCADICNNTNVESKTQSVVKYFIDDILSTSITGQREDSYVLAFCAWCTV